MEYHTFQKSAGERFGPVAWAPYWEVILTHAQPDGASAGEFARPFFVNRHVRPEVALDWACRITRDSPGNDETLLGCHVSGAALPPGSGGSLAKDLLAPLWTQDELQTGRLYRAEDQRTAHQRDWDILSEAVQQAYAVAGVSERSAPLDRIRALAVLQNEHKAKVYPSRHPVDTLLYSSYCTGASNLFAALCMLAGFPVRTLNNAIHSMAEVWDGQRWLFVDNLTAGQEVDLVPTPGRKADSVFMQNYLQMLAGQGTCADGSPMLRKHVLRYAEEQPYFEPYLSTATRDWRFDHGRFGNGPAMAPRLVGVGLYALPAPDNIRAIYPEWAEPLLFARAGRACELSLTPRQGWVETVIRLDRGLGLRKSFYVGQLDDGKNPVRAARADLHLSDWIGSEFDPVRGGWVLLLNGRSLPLDASVMTLHEGLLSLALLLGLLKENAMNQVELCSEKRYEGSHRYRMPDTLAVRAYPDSLGTELPWYGSGEAARYLCKWEPPEGAVSVYDTHSAWLMVPDGI